MSRLPESKSRHVLERGCARLDRLTLRDIDVDQESSKGKSTHPASEHHSDIRDIEPSTFSATIERFPSACERAAVILIVLS